MSKKRQYYITEQSIQIKLAKLKQKNNLFFKLNKEYFILSKLILAKISLQHFLNHKAQQTGTYNC